MNIAIQSDTAEVAVTTAYQTAARVACGWQCPECFGVAVITLRFRSSDRVEGFVCNECGCQWGSR